LALDVPECIKPFIDEKGGLRGIRDLIPPDDRVRRASRIFRALASPVRLKILKLLEDQPLCPCILTEAVGVASSKLSYHLSSLQTAGLIESRQEGRWIIYGLTPLGEKVLDMATDLTMSREPQ